VFLCPDPFEIQKTTPNARTFCVPCLKATLAKAIIGPNGVFWQRQKSNQSGLGCKIAGFRSFFIQPPPARNPTSMTFSACPECQTSTQNCQLEHTQDCPANFNILGNANCQARRTGNLS
jgi:hypothetical protein